uniref:Uncharacterized protein n=1 Tax=Romanomermis culicivorax TaxID=13658 RepID=A0A915ICI1_ROMCU
MITPEHQPPETETEEDIMNVSDKTLTNVPKKATADIETIIDVASPAVDPTRYLVTPAAMPGQPMIATAAAKYIPPIYFLQQYISESQSTTLASMLKAYGFWASSPIMLSPEHHWRDYTPALHDHISAILMLAPITMLMARQPTPSVQTALIDA